MIFDNILFELGLILAGSAVLATVFLFGRQPIILAYIAAGIAAGPHGFALIERADHIESIAHVGVVLLLFLPGVHLQPAKLLQLFRRGSLALLHQQHMEDASPGQTSDRVAHRSDPLL